MAQGYAEIMGQYTCVWLNFTLRDIIFHLGVTKLTFLSALVSLDSFTCSREGKVTDCANTSHHWAYSLECDGLHKALTQDVQNGCR